MNNEKVDLVAQKNADDSFRKSCFHGEYLNNYRLEYVRTRILWSMGRCKFPSFYFFYTVAAIIADHTHGKNFVIIAVEESDYK